MWISILKQKPEDLQEVLIFDELLGINIAQYYKSMDAFIGKDDRVLLKHTKFWMPLPASPDLESSGSQL